MENANMKEKLNSETLWKESVDSWVAEHFAFLGFKKAGDFMKVRLYDFFNLDCVDNNRAEEMIVGLLHFLYPDREEYYESYMPLEVHAKMMINLMPHPSEITIGDLLKEESFSEEEMLLMFDYITQSFYKSDEYDSRHYKYGNIREIKRKKTER